MKKRAIIRLIALVTLLVALLAFIFLNDQTSIQKFTSHPSLTPTKQATSEKISEIQSTSQSQISPQDLPSARSSDWELVLVNRTSTKPELNPSLASVGSIQVDQRIANQVTEFLAAAQKISPAEHLISGYRSVAYQSELYEGYIQDEMAGHGTVNVDGKPISRQEAIKNVQTYSQPPGSSEHQTGLAIDMSDIDSLNASQVAPQIAAIAPNYGFILRFPAGKQAETGVDYEDWHFRYVGIENAKYMTEHKLTLEEYLKLLPNK